MEWRHQYPGRRIAKYTLLADGVYCDYDLVKKKADIGSNFLERE